MTVMRVLFHILNCGNTLIMGLLLWICQTLHHQLDENATSDGRVLLPDDPPVTLSARGTPVSSSCNTLCSVTRRICRNLENQPGRPLTIRLRSCLAPIMRPCLWVSASTCVETACAANASKFEFKTRQKSTIITIKKCKFLLPSAGRCR